MNNHFAQYREVTLAEHNARVLADLDHGPQSSLDPARAERDRDHLPAGFASLTAAKPARECGESPPSVRPTARSAGPSSDRSYR